MTNKGQRWVFHKDAEAKTVGEGFVRRILAFDEELMCVENAFEKGAAAPLHSHPHLQIAYVTEGVFDFEVDGEVRTVRKGDSIWLESNIPHGVTRLEAGAVRDIFCPMRKDFV